MVFARLAKVWICGAVGAMRHESDLSLVLVTVPLSEKSRALCPSGRFPPSFIHDHVIIITRLNKLGLDGLAMKMA